MTIFDIGPPARRPAGFPETSIPHHRQHHMTRVRILLLAVIAVAGLTAGGSTSVTLRRHNAPVDGEVCRFEASHPENPFHRWLASQQVVCVPSGRVEFPDGLWNVFGRTADAISLPVIVESSAAPSSLDLPLGDAARLGVVLPPEHAAVLYAPRSAASFPAEGKTLVPAGEDLWLILLARGAPVSVVPIAATAAGAERNVTAQRSQTPALLGWISIPEADRAALAKARGMIAPKILWKGDGRENAGEIPAPPEALHGTFFLVRGAAGNGSLEGSGRGWLPFRKAMTADAQSLTVMREPLALRTSATLVVNWSILGDLEALDRSLGSCDPASETPVFELTISACAAPKSRGDRVDPATCHPIRREPLALPNTYGTVTIGDVVPGHYRVELRYGKLPPYAVMADVGPLQQRPVSLQASWIAAYGSLTRSGEPLEEDATMEFPGGVGFSKARSGEYKAVLTRPFGIDAKVEVKECRSARAAFVLTDTALRPNTRLDIDIPDNELAISAIDTFTRSPLANPRARLTLVSLRVPKRPVYVRDLIVAKPEQEHDGVTHERRRHFLLRGVPEREIRLTVSHAGYQKAEVDPFSITRTEKKALEVQLVPLRGTSARVRSSKPFEGGMVFWYAQSGEEVERAELEPDGSFFFEMAHGAGETMTVVSRSHPLWILRAPGFGRREGTEISFPDAPGRTTEVTVLARDRRYAALVGVAIGGLRVPTPAMAYHMALRDSAAVVRAASPLTISDLGQTGPIEIILGPQIERLASGRNFDMLALPQHSDLPRRRLQPGMAGVTFEVK